MGGSGKIKVIDQLAFNQEITIIGMGDTNEKEEKPLKLQYANVKRISDKECFKKAYPKTKSMKKKEKKQTSTSAILTFETFRGVENSGFCIKVNSILFLKGHSHASDRGKSWQGRVIITTIRSGQIRPRRVLIAQTQLNI